MAVAASRTESPSQQRSEARGRRRGAVSGRWCLLRRGEDGGEEGEEEEVDGRDGRSGEQRRRLLCVVMAPDGECDLIVVRWVKECQPRQTDSSGGGGGGAHCGLLRLSR